MNVLEKIKQQKLIQQNIEGRSLDIKKVVTLRNGYRNQLAKLELQKENYTQEFMESQKKEIYLAYKTKCDGLFTEFVKSLEELRFLINERDADLDLGNPSMDNALATIKLVGDKISVDTCRKLNDNFRHDQSALRILQEAYETTGVPVITSKINLYVYDLDQTIDDLIQVAQSSIVYGGSLNLLAYELYKLGTHEGATVDKAPDQVGIDEAWAKGAGLTVTGEWERNSSDDPPMVVGQSGKLGY